MSNPPRRLRPMVVIIVAFVLIGTPLFAYLWHVLNEGLAGHATVAGLLLAVPTLAALLLLIRALLRRLVAFDQDF